MLRGLETKTGDIYIIFTDKFRFCLDFNDCAIVLRKPGAMFQAGYIAEHNRYRDGSVIA
jgi:hypothetical protein